VRTKARTDANQADLVEALRACGASVQPLHAVGRGCPDLLIGIGGHNLLLEVKDGSKPPSKRTLTDDQVRWHAEWRGQVCVVSSAVEALEACGIQFRGQIS